MGAPRDGATRSGTTYFRGLGYDRLYFLACSEDRREAVNKMACIGGVDGSGNTAASATAPRAETGTLL